MPKINGTSLLGILAATFVFYMLGFLWYGIVFQEAWMSANNITMEMAEAHNAKLGAMTAIKMMAITSTTITSMRDIPERAWRRINGRSYLSESE